MSVDVTKNACAESVLEFIESYYFRHGYAPKQSEICDHLSLSKGYTSKLIAALAEAGKLIKAGSGWRQIDLPRRKKREDAWRIERARETMLKQVKA